MGQAPGEQARVDVLEEFEEEQEDGDEQGDEEEVAEEAFLRAEG